MEPVFSTCGALLGLVLAIVLIVRKVTPAYALVFGALFGGLAGGGGLVDTVAAMISGTQAMMPSVLRILASGVLVGALVKTGSAAKIADAIVAGLGSRFALAAVALATLIVTAVGVFVDIAVITVAPVALAVGKKAGIPIPALLLATASTTAGVTIAGQTFAGTLLQAGIPAVSAAAMLHAGGTIFDALPHGSFFHATAGAVGMSVKDRLKIFPLGALVGATTTVTSALIHLLFR